MASHGIARTSRPKTQEQKLQDIAKIKKYRDLEDQIRTSIAKNDYSPEVFKLSTKLLKLNPEYYTVWNARRRSLISGLLSKPSAGSWLSRASPSSSQNVTTTPSSAAFSSSSSTGTQQDPEHQIVGRNGTTADEARDNSKEEDGNQSIRDDDTAQQENIENDAAVLRSELNFTIPLLMDFPKCYWIWNYRLWILEQAIQRLDVQRTRRIWEEELGLDSKVLTKDHRNFHAWGYRRHLVEQLESPALDGKSLVEAEFEYTTKMIHMDLSNFSAWHNRSKLIPRLLTERGADDVGRQEFLDTELGLVRRALNVGPEDQSLWYYHQYLMLNLTDYVGHSTITPGFSQEQRITYVTREIDDIKEFLEDYDDIKWIYEALMKYTIALIGLEGREPEQEERRDLQAWLERLEALDPKRNGRWKDVGAEVGLVRHMDDGLVSS